MLTNGENGRVRPRVLRVTVLFHESQALGSGIAVARVLERLSEEYGWLTSGWFPGDGPLFDQFHSSMSTYGKYRRPVAVSVRGWREAPGPLARLRATPKYLNQLKNMLLHVRPHVVHANTLHSLPEATVAKRLGLPVVLHVHELPAPGLKRAATLTWAGGIADQFVAVSGPVAEMLEPYARGAPVTLIHNGVPIIERTKPLDGRAVVVGTVGAVCRRKGTDVFLEAAARVQARRPDITFEHVGPAETSGDHAFDRRVARECQAGNVEMRGPHPGIEAMEDWSIFALPSRQDPFPLASLEAMMMGLPVVASNVGGLREQISHLVNGILVEPGDPASLARWIERLADDAELRQRLGAAAARTVRDRFGLARQVRLVHGAYIEAMNRPHPPPAP